MNSGLSFEYVTEEIPYTASLLSKARVDNDALLLSYKPLPGPKLEGVAAQDLGREVVTFLGDLLAVVQDQQEEKCLCA